MLFCFFVFYFIFQREKERQSMSRGGAERQRQNSEAGSRLRAVSTEPNAGLKPTSSVRSWPVLKSDAQPTEPPRHLLMFLFFFFFCFFLFCLIYFLERQTVQAWVGKREGETESEADSRLWTISTDPNAGLKLTNHEIMAWAKVGYLTNWATQAPLDVLNDNPHHWEKYK